MHGTGSKRSRTAPPYLHGGYLTHGRFRFGLVAFSSSICLLLILITFCKWCCISQTATKQLIIKETLHAGVCLHGDQWHKLYCGYCNPCMHVYKTNTHHYFLLMVYAITTSIVFQQ